MDNTILKNKRRKIKKSLRIRKKLRGNASKPRLCVVRSNTSISAQVIDDEAGKTIVSLSTLSKEMKEAGFGKKNVAAAKEIGTRLGKLMLEKSINQVVFDRGPAKYHGIIAAVADAARELGVKL